MAQFGFRDQSLRKELGKNTFQVKVHDQKTFKESTRAINTA